MYDFYHPLCAQQRKVTDDVVVQIRYLALGRLIYDDRQAMEGTERLAVQDMVDSRPVFPTIHLGPFAHIHGYNDLA
jgi:hypothetical protein